MSEAYKKLIKTLQTLFEMDKADLDFGIYRIMNQKRDEINQFLENDLLPQVKEAFADYADGSQSELKKELQAAIDKAREFGSPDPENAPAVVKIKEKMASSVDITAVENEVYSHLHTFFSRYYDKGDFISQRSYKKDTYAIPYEGEDVKLYWANHDQYYVKSSEHLRDYAFIVRDDDGKTVRIKLVEADTEKDNVKAEAGKERRFVLDADNPLSVENGELHIHFHYCPAGKKKQEALNKEAVEIIFQQEGVDDWLELLRQKAPTDKNPDRTLLEKHLNDYTARNTFDYFIHKDLGGFLRRELDFYIKNEVLHLDDIDDAAFDVTEQHLRKIKVIRAIAHKIIRMLAQLEDFQKKLWLKKKFVVETNYCITLDRVPEELYGEIVANKAQHEEWVKLGFTAKDTSITGNYLKEHPCLMLDTRFFDKGFKERLLKSIDDIDEQCDGLLIQSDNFQALHFIESTYHRSVQVVYIDPPYNTEYSKIAYKNNFEHSSWLSLIGNTLPVSKRLFSDDFPFGVAIDDYEFKNLAKLIDQGFPDMEISTVIVNHHPQGSGGRLSRTHEYYLLVSDDGLPSYKGEPIDDGVEERSFMRSGRGENNWREYRWRSFYALLVDKDTTTIVGAEEPVPLGKKFPTEDTADGYKRIYPINSRGEERVWRSSYETGKKRAENGELIISPNGTVYQIINHQGRRETLFSNWTSSEFNAGTQGTAVLDSLGLGGIFDYPKSIKTIEKGLWAQSFGSDNTLVLDYFAGSGTTAHAVININRDYGGKRKYIVVEMGDYFGAVLKPRIEKTVYSKQWQNGTPQANSDGSYNGVSHCFKYLRLESYEDTLNNLILKKRPNQQQELLARHSELHEDYMLGYWLDVETADSPSLLNIEQFEDPFNYKLNIAIGSVGATKPTRVYLVETFNYLLGLHVKTIDTVRGFKVVTGANPKEESVLVIWRNLKEKDNAALEAFLDTSGYNPKDTEFDHIYVNGDHTLEDPQSKVKMIEIEFKRLMFDVQDV